MGTFSGSNPSSPPNGYWWYRVDTGQIWMNVNGTIMPVQGTGSVTIISTNTTIANTDVYNDIIVMNGATLTIYGAVTFHGNVIILNGATLLSSNPNASSSSPATNTYQFLGNFYLNGTYEIAQYNTDNINNSITISTIASAGGANPTISGSGTLSIPSGVTLTVNVATTISVSTLSVAGTLTISANVTVSISTISGAGTLSVSSGYTLTQGAALTISIANISVAGTWANAGYGITIPSGATVSWKTTGSLTTASTAGTLTINGTLYYYGISLTYGVSDPGLPSFPLTLAGTGIGLFTSNNTSSGGNSVSLSNATISAGSNSSSGASGATGIAPRLILTSISGSAVGKYGLEDYNSGSYYYQLMLVYIGTANTTYNVNFTGVAGLADVPNSGYTGYVRNASGSAGSITITGTLYV